MLAADPEAIRVIHEWVQKAENDLTAAAQILKLGKYSLQRSYRRFEER